MFDGDIKDRDLLRWWPRRLSALRTDEAALWRNKWTNLCACGTDDVTPWWNGLTNSHAFGTDEVTLWLNGLTNLCTYGRTKRRSDGTAILQNWLGLYEWIYWRTWLCQLRMTDETLTNDVELRRCFEGTKRQMRNRCARNGTGLEQPLWGEERNDRGVKGGRTGESPRPRRMCGYREPELEGDDPGKRDKIADATDEICRPNSSRPKVG